MDKQTRTKWETGRYEPKSLVSSEDKKAIKAYYKAETGKGRPSEEVLPELSEHYGRSTRQIQRYLAGPISVPNGGDGGSTRPGTVTEEEPIQAELSGHWPALRNTAKLLRHQLSGGAPLAHLLDFPWQHSPDLNGALTVYTQGKSIEVTLEAEGHLLFGALNQHLTRDPAWVFLAKWKLAVEEVALGLDGRCQWVKEHPELEGRNWITVEKLREGAMGITEFFPKSIVLGVSEQLCHRSQAQHELLVEGHEAKGRWLLRWVRNSSWWAECAASHERDEIVELGQIHGSVGEQMRKTPEANAVARAWLKVNEVAKALDTELERIENLVRFPGACSLYHP